MSFVLKANHAKKKNAEMERTLLSFHYVLSVQTDDDELT